MERSAQCTSSTTSRVPGGSVQIDRMARSRTWKNSAWLSPRSPPAASGSGGSNVAQRVGQRRERQGTRQGHAAARQDAQTAARGRRGHLLDQARLARPRLAAEQHRPRLPGRGLVEGAGQRGQLGAAADEGAGGDLASTGAVWRDGAHPTSPGRIARRRRCPQRHALDQRTHRRRPLDAPHGVGPRGELARQLTEAVLEPVVGEDLRHRPHS